MVTCGRYASNWNAFLFTNVCRSLSISYFLQFLESVNMVLVVGLSVDYCVHLAEGYSRSTHTDRKNRIRDSLTEVCVHAPGELN